MRILKPSISISSNPPVRQKNKSGRPTKFTPETRRRILRAVEKGMPLTHAANGAGITLQSLITYRRQHLKFTASLEQAIARGVESRLKKIEEASEAGDWRASAWLLEHCPGSAEHFSRSRIELTGAGGSPLAAVVGIYLPKKDGDAPAVEVTSPKQIENGN